MTHEPTEITKKSAGLFVTLGLSKTKETVVLKVGEEFLEYNSTLGNIGRIKSSDIQFIDLGKVGNSPAVKIGLVQEFNLASKLTKFSQKLTERYKKESGADILVFPQDIDIELEELYAILKNKLKK